MMMSLRRPRLTPFGFARGALHDLLNRFGLVVWPTMAKFPGVLAITR
jgi:hypothetical protein